MVLGFSRGIVVVGSAVFLAVGLFIWSAEGEPLPGFLVGAVGVAGLAIAVLERMRYHSEVEETDTPRAGSSGGLAPGQPLEPRFQRTDEVFLDPSTSRRMRVYVDSATGERRYRAED
jgi:hypothetical protein